MKKTGIWAGLALVMLMAACRAEGMPVIDWSVRAVSTPEPGSGPCAFAEPSVERAVRSALGKGAEEEIGADELADVTELELKSAGISSLEDLSAMTGLKKLVLSDNQISDLAPLSGLTGLVYLDLDRNRIRDLTPLSGLTGLEYLDLAENRIVDIAPLSGLAAIRDLWLNDNRITDLTPLAGLTGLTNLNLWSNRISNLKPLAGLTGLKKLHLSNNLIMDLKPLSGLTGLEQLHLKDNWIGDLAPLSGLRELKTLGLYGNRIDSVAPLAGLTGLEQLYLADNRIVDIAPLSGLTGLRELYLGGNEIDDLSALSGLSGLESLSLAGMDPGVDLSPLSGLSGLKKYDGPAIDSPQDEASRRQREERVAEARKRIAPLCVESHDGHSYALFEHMDLSWTEAAAHCESLGGHLADVRDAGERQFIASLVKRGSQGMYWLGGRRDEAGVFRWTDGSEVSLNKDYWDYGQPDNGNRDKENYLQIFRVANPDAGEGNSQPYRWNDSVNDNTWKNSTFFTLQNVGFICEWDELILQTRYEVFEGLNLKWREAKDFCRDRGGYLVCINSEEEQRAIESLIRDGSMGMYWIGARRDDEGAFQWLDGSAWTYENWDNGQPDNANGGKENYAQIYRIANPDAGEGNSAAFRWNDSVNSNKWGGSSFFTLQNVGFICEYDDNPWGW